MRIPCEERDTDDGAAHWNILWRLIDHADKFSFKPFLVIVRCGSTQQFTYAEALWETRRWAHVFNLHGVRNGDRVFIALKHRQELYFSFLGAMWLGAVPSIIPYPTPKQNAEVYWAEYKAMFARVEPRVLVTYADNIAPVRAALAGRPCTVLDVDAAEIACAHSPASPEPLAISPGGLALLQFSSGTTGLRKGVMLSHGQIAAHMDAYARAIDFCARDIVASWLPLYHDMGLIACFLMPLYAGATIVSIDAFEWVAKPWTLLEEIETYRATLTWLPNFAFRHIVRTLPDNRAFKLHGVRAFINSSETCRPETFDQFAQAMKDHGVRPEQLQTCYGMAEAVLAVSQTAIGRLPRTLTVDRRLLEATGGVRIVDASHPHSRSFLSCGRPIENLNIRVTPPEDDQRVSGSPHGNMVGEIEVRGAHVFGGYFRNDAAARAALAGGWYRTGDLGFIDNGELFVCGRKKDLLIVHGRNYYTHDIETAVSSVEHAKPGRTVVFGIEDATSASEEAIVLLETDLSDPSEQRALCRAVKEAIFDRMELMVKSVRVVEPGSLIKTTSGKVSRTGNKERYLAGLSAGA